MTPTRADLLERCDRAGSDGYQPKGSEWPSIYWLHARSMLTACRQDRLKPPRFIITTLGKAALKDQEALT